ncbi:YncE family protein [Tepidibacillus sp. HK-1]|uniref:YncE family protein n=1 Tax=Tepidibacillus sp. HK-1 TaxID=1883407 RepID=UPI000853634A|nr:hypothetical protein [Tepidibacillus sp. HK-1]GBF10255.1 lactonase, 7-bladed beta-propeller [Tepidibacillus sp. HK-1]
MKKYIFTLIILILATGCSTKTPYLLRDSDSAIFVAVVNKGQILVIDPIHFQKIAEITTDAPVQHLLLSPDQKILYASGKEMNQLFLFDAHTGKLIGKYPIGGGIIAQTISKDGQYLYFGTQEGSIYQWDAYDLQITRKMEIGQEPATLQISENGQFLYVGLLEEGKVKEIDIKQWVVTRDFKGPKRTMGIGLNLESRRLWVGGHGDAEAPNDKIYEINLDQGTYHPLQTGLMPIKIEFDEKTKKLYVLNHGSNQLSIFSLNGKEKDKKTVYVGNNPFDFTIANGYIYVSNYDSRSLNIFEEESLQKVKEIDIGGHPLSIVYMGGE